MSEGKRKVPNGFVAECQCGNNVGVIERKKVSTKELGQILGRWLANGCTVHPQFGSWSCELGPCECPYPPVDISKRRVELIASGKIK